MADASGEPRGPGAWPWIGGIVVVALLIWGLARLLDVGAPVAAETARPAAGAAP